MIPRRRNGNVAIRRVGTGAWFVTANRDGGTDLDGGELYRVDTTTNAVTGHV